MKTAMSALALLITLTVPALGSGMLIPKDESVPPLAIKYQRVDISIKDGTATAKIEQVFKNSVKRDLEATYIFPLPSNASIADFAMYINGKRMSGELVEKGKARKIYEDIIRRMKDPGLLEHMGGNLFKVRVYPVPSGGEQKLEISYSQTLSFDNGLYKLVYPLKTSDKASRTLDDFTTRVTLNSSLPIKNIYSPSHDVGITRKGEYGATIGFEEDKALLDRDFVLYYGVSNKDFGLNMLTHARKGEDGYFMMMLAPNVAPGKEDILERDITFVIDSSGSMSGKKIKQAREALKYCLTRLNDGDRFNVIRFSTDVETLSDDLLEVTEKNHELAEDFIETIDARGGTDINGALATALKLKRDRSRPHFVVFLTDGKPTVGETDKDTILDNVKNASDERTRIFVFGVGANLNTHLLDRVSGDHGGISRYVLPEEDIEVKVSSFADKMSRPVLSRPELVVDRLKTRMIHPQDLPDLFSGEQFIVFGRYDGSGDYAIKLQGEVNGKKREFVYEGTFPEANNDNDFIPRLWATRRVGYLLDQIRLHGEDDELKDEVVLLGKEHGIMTPYTSYLVLETEKDYEKHGITRPKAEDQWLTTTTTGARPSRGRLEREAGVIDERNPMPEPAAVPVFGDTRNSVLSGSTGARTVAPADSIVSMNMQRTDGLDAVELSKAIRRYKEADKPEEKRQSASLRHVGRKIFYLVNNVWTDRDYKKDIKTRKLKYASKEYFELLEKKPELKKFLALGERVIVCLDDGSAIEIVTE